MADLRLSFREITDGWMLVHDHDALTERIERAAAWTEENGPLKPDEEALIKFMIACQLAGFGLPGHHKSDDDDADRPG